MTTAGPWSVKGIDPKAREVAKDLARRSGLTLGEWLNQMIGETAEAPGADSYPEAQAAREWSHQDWAEPPPRPRAEPAPAVEGLRARLQGAGAAADAAEMNRIARAMGELTARIEGAEHRSTLAISGIDQQAMGVLSRIDGVERDQTAVAARFEGAIEDVRKTQTAMAERIRRMGEDDGPRVEAMKALEGALGRVATQLYEGESRARAQATEVREDVTALVRRMDRAEADRAVAVDTSPLEEAIARLSTRIDEAQGRTDTAVRALETSFAGLDARFGEREAAGERAFERLAADLSAKVESGRAETTERLNAITGVRMDGLEARLRELTGQVAERERKSADAIDRMGREVVRIAQGLGARMDVSERRTQAAADASLAEAHRLHAAVDHRLKAADAHQAEAVEKLGGEIAKIAEKLGDRIAAAERRASSELSRGLDDAADRLGRATASLNHRHDQAASELAERIKASEERTARLIGEARAALAPAPAPLPAPVATFAPAPEAREPEPEPAPAAAEAPAPSHAFTFTAPKLKAAPAVASSGLPSVADLAAEMERGERAPPPAYVAAPPPSPPKPEPEYSFAETAFPAELPEELPEDIFPPAPAPAAAPVFAEAEFEDTPEDAPMGGPAPHAGFHASPFGETIDAELHDPFEPLLAPAASAHTAIAPPPPEPPTSETPRTGSTRDLIEQARAAARAGAEIKNRKGARASDMFSVPAPGFEDAEAKPQRGPFGLPPLRRKKREGGATVRTALFASGLAATISMAAAGAILLNASEGGEHGHGDAPTAAPLTSQTAALPAPTAAPEQLAVATAPGAGLIPAPALASAPAAIDTAPISPPAEAPASAKLLYSAAVRTIEGGDSSGVADLKRAANLGYAPAQFYLGRLYQEGRGGLKADADEGRRWTERAAKAGDPRAMFSLGLSYANGLPGGAGATDDRGAVAWFRAAADRGLRDAQFNLAVMHQSGRGVPKSPAEAYKWFTIAAGAGDPEARASAEALKPQLSPEALAVAERSAQAYRAQAAAAQIRTAAN